MKVLGRAAEQHAGWNGQDVRNKANAKKWRKQHHCIHIRPILRNPCRRDPAGGKTDDRYAFSQGVGMFDRQGSLIGQFTGCHPPLLRVHAVRPSMPGQSGNDDIGPVLIQAFAKFAKLRRGIRQPVQEHINILCPAAMGKNRGKRAGIQCVGRLIRNREFLVEGDVIAGTGKCKGSKRNHIQRGSEMFHQGGFQIAL